MYMKKTQQIIGTDLHKLLACFRIHIL